MDQYAEQILKANPTLKQRLLLAGSIALTAVGVFLMIFVSGSMGITLIIIGAVLIGLSINRQNTEYEYEFTNTDCDIARIINKSSRKDVYSFTDGDVLRILPYSSEKFQNELQVNTNMAIKDFTSGNRDREKAWFAFLISASDTTTAVILELNEKTYNHIKKCYKAKYEEK